MIQKLINSFNSSSNGQFLVSSIINKQKLTVKNTNFLLFYG